MEGVEVTTEIGAIAEFFTEECEMTFAEETAMEGEDFSDTDFDWRTDERCAGELDLVEVKALRVIFAVAEDFWDSELEI